MVMKNGIFWLEIASGLEKPRDISPPSPPPLKKKSELKIRRQRDSTTADLVEGAWGEVAVAMARKIALRKLARRRVVVAPFPVERV